MVELRYFGGLTVDETATVLKVSPETVMRDWTMAKTWLHRALSRQLKYDAATIRTFDGAVSLSPGDCSHQRAAFLDQVSAEDAELRRELESLLAAHEQRAT